MANVIKYFFVFVFFNYFILINAAAENERFKVYWNLPSANCKGEDAIHPEWYNIIANTDQAFMGDKIVTLYEENLGLYPKIIADFLLTFKENFYKNYSIVEIINGGLPQKSNLTLHLAKVEKDIEKYVPNPNFNGPLIIDYESWRSLLDLNWGSRSHYLYESIKWVHQRFPQISERLAKRIATDEFDRASRKFMVKTIQLVKKLRPQALVGFYDYTICNYDAGKAEHEFECNQRHKEANERLFWLYRECKALFPSIYYYNKDAMKDINNWRLRYTYARINEAILMREMLGIKIPIIPFTKMEYSLKNTQDKKNFYSKPDICLSVAYAANFDIQGLIIWSTSAKMKNRCSMIQIFLDIIYGQKINKIINNIEKCNIKLCSNHGRCVAKTLNENFICNFHPWIIKNHYCSCDNGWSGDKCQNPVLPNMENVGPKEDEFEIDLKIIPEIDEFVLL